MATREGWRIDSAWEFQDEAKSAYHGNRGDGLASARTLAAALAAEHGQAILVVQHSSRFARGDAVQAQHLAEVFLWALRAGVQLRSVQDDAMVTSLLTSVVAGDQNHAESKRKGESIKGGMRRRAAQRGRPNGGARTYGYRYRDVTEDGKPTGPLVVVEVEARVVERVYAEYLSGSGQRQIARGLVEDGVPTATGGRWYQGTVRNLLANPFYGGQVALNGEIYAGKHEAIIDRQTWEQVRLLREALVRSPGKGRGRYPKGRHLFTKGLLRCGLCGSAMTPVTKPTRTPDQLYEIYTCFRRLHDGPHACSMPHVRRDLIDTAVWRYFENVALDVDATRKAIDDQATRKLSEVAALTAQAERELARAEAALGRIEADYIRGAITADQWTRLEFRLVGEIAAARGEVEQHRRQQERVVEDLAEVDSEAAMLDELTSIRQVIAGEAQAASADGVEPFRATLRRLFSAFELVSPARPFGSEGTEGIPWVPTAPEHQISADRFVIAPHVRPEAADISLDADFSAGFPALHRAAVALGGNKQNPFTR